MNFDAHAHASTPEPAADSPQDSTHTAPADNSAHLSSTQRALREEQEFLDTAYSALDTDLAYYTAQLTRVRAQGAVGTPSARSERDSFATHYEDTVLRLRNVEHRLVLGRLDFHDDSNPIHIGRTTLRDEEKNILLTDWRAPQSQAFYQATAAHPDNISRRRHIQTRFREVIGVEDELLQTPQGTTHSELNLTGEGALIAAISQARDGKMGDIVATIQSEQDRIIRADSKGVLVVQGGPGTGKTAVALHRAAYLLYAERERLSHSGVLLIGPSQRFLDYIDQVLPSLGESNVVAVTMGELFPGVTPSVTDSPEAADIKSRIIWRTIARRAVPKILQKPMDASITVRISGKKITLTPDDVSIAQRRARQSGKPHNQARHIYAKYLVELLADRLAAALHTNVSESDWLIRDIAEDPDLRREINRHWLPASAQWLLEHIYTWPEILSRIAPELSPSEKAALYRERGSGFSLADIPLLDELAEHLGEFSSDIQRRQHDARQHSDQQLESYVKDTMSSMGLGGGIVRSADLLARISSGSEHLTMAETAAADRSWTYGHVVVDEAQELTPMQWAMIARRNPSRSMTIVGDIDQRVHSERMYGELTYSDCTRSEHTYNEQAQSRCTFNLGGQGDDTQNTNTYKTSSHKKHISSGAETAWQSILGALSTSAQIEKLTVSYRTPSSILDRAAQTMGELGYPVQPVQGVRDIADSYSSKQVLSTDLLSTINETVQQMEKFLDNEYGHGLGSLAVIAPSNLHIQIQDALMKPAQHQLRAGVISAQASKGLEYDAVIVVEPADIAQESMGNLYVALTRATKKLSVIATHSIPRALQC